MSDSDDELPESAFKALGLGESSARELRSEPRDSVQDVSPNIMQADATPGRAVSPNETAITVYAEVLLNIRTVTLFASLTTHKEHSTKAYLHNDGDGITISHEGESAEIRLPIKAKGTSDAALELPASHKTKELSMRLQIEEEEGSDLFGGANAEERRANIVPWDGASLSGMKDVQVLCKHCQKAVLPTGKITEWRDLPSENWAEMMDFWHCHKPDEHHLHDPTHEEAVAKKGYAAGTRLQATKGIGFVDLASCLLKDQDCEGVQVGPLFPYGYRLSGVKKAIFALSNGSIVDTSTPNEQSPLHAYALRSFSPARVDG